MAALRRLLKSPYWIACFTLPDGTRTQRSTKSTDRREAQRIANKFEDASDEASEGRLTEVQARKVIADIAVHSIYLGYHMPGTLKSVYHRNAKESGEED